MADNVFDAIVAPSSFVPESAGAGRQKSCVKKDSKQLCWKGAGISSTLKIM